MIFRHEDVSKILRSNDYLVSDLSAYFAEKEPYIFKSSPESCPYLSKATRQWPMYLNGEHHRKVRTAIARAFSSLEIDPIIEKALHITTPQFNAKSTFDLVDYCSSFILEVIKGVFNISNEHYLQELRHYSNLLAKSQDLFVPKQVYVEINDKLLWGKELFPKSDFRAILESSMDGEGLSSDDLYSLLAISLMAAFETSKDNLSLALLELMKSEELIESTQSTQAESQNLLIEELLRFSSPLQYTVRVNKFDTSVGSATIPANSKVYLCLASANRDPEAFKEPNTIFPHRNPNPHLSFGGGQHFCLGASIARAEMRQCLKPMTLFLANYEPIEAQQKWSKQIFMRTASALPLKKK